MPKARTQASSTWNRSIDSCQSHTAACASCNASGDVSTAPEPHDAEPHGQGLYAKLNWLRAGVLGANDGIVSTASLIVGVAAAAIARHEIVLAGLAGLVAGALSTGGPARSTGT